MSFADFDAAERGQRGGRTAPDRSNDPGVAIHDRAFAALTQRISVQIFKLNANVIGINKCVDVLGSAADSPSVRKKLANLTEVTRELVKSSTDDVKQLASYPVNDRQQTMEQAKVSRDFQTAVAAFQKAQRHSAEKQRHHVERAKASLSDAAEAPALTPRAETEQLLELEDRPAQQQAQAQEQLVPDSELEFQETLIEEREGDIREIEAGILELNEIFRDLGTIVHEQQSMLDNIESNVISIANDTAGASSELTTAHAYQRKAGRRMLCLLMIFCIVLAIVLIAVLA